MSKWTPGPWSIGATGAVIAGNIADGARKVIAVTPSPHPANESLISAAPELVEALQALLAQYVGLIESGDAGHWNAEADPQVISARAALRKAGAV